MSKDWNYAKLSQEAKLAGGPEKLITKIKDYYFQEGITKGRKQMNPVIAITGLTGIGVGVAGLKLYEYIKNKKKNDDDIITEEEVIEAEEQLLKEIQEYINDDDLQNSKVETELECTDNSQKIDEMKVEEEQENEEEK